MMGSVIAPIVPGAGNRGEKRRASASRPTRRSQPPLPLVTVPTPREGSTVYGMTVLDRHGRLADRIVLQALGWVAGTRLVIGGTGELVTLQASGAGNTSAESYVTAQGYLRLPARIRQRCGLWPGDRVLLAADPSDLLLRVYPPSTLDNLLGAFLGHADLRLGGGLR
jgi:hypothetical protein